MSRAESVVPRVAIAHDWLNQAGGAEVVLSELHSMYPSAPIYTTIADRSARPDYAGSRIRVSGLDRLPAIHQRHQWYLPLYPLVWSHTRVHDADVVISNKSAFCFGLDAREAVHICYCLTPTRFVWDVDHYLTHESLPRGTGMVMAMLVPWLRRWELRASTRVDHFLAISTVVQERIKAAYGRESEVVFPPVDTRSYQPGPLGDFHLVLARLVPYKRIDLAVQAFNTLGRRLIIAGTGRDEERLRRMAGPTIEFVGRVDEAEARRLLGTCRGLIWPGVEDYGLVPVEAMASGRPVIARRAGGVLDTVGEGTTGLFFDRDEPAALAAAVRRADEIDWQQDAIRNHAMAFDSAAFRARMSQIVGLAWHARLSRPVPQQPARAPEASRGTRLRAEPATAVGTGGHR